MLYLIMGKSVAHFTTCSHLPAMGIQAGVQFLIARVSKYAKRAKRSACLPCLAQAGGRLNLKVLLQHMPPKTGMTSLFLNWKIPFHAAPAQEGKKAA